MDVEIVAERVRPGKGGDAGVLHVKKSLPLLRATRAALAKVFAEEFPSHETAREYALGWLDGDGTITRNRMAMALGLAGYEEEQKIVLRALHYAFDWPARNYKFGGVRSGTTRSLNIREAAELALAGGFSFSMSRARLLYGLEWGVIAPRKISDGDAAAAHLIMKKLAPEIETLRRLMPPERVPVGVKGLPYPLIDSRLKG